MTDDSGGNACPGGTLQPEGVCLVADYAADDVATRCALVDQCLQIAAVARDQNHDRAGRMAHRGLPSSTTGLASAGQERMLPMMVAPLL